MRYTFEVIVSFHPLADAETREQTLREQLNAYLNSLTFSINAGIEPISKNRIDLKRVPRMEMTTRHKRAKPRDRRYMKNDARARISAAKK